MAVYCCFHKLEFIFYEVNHVFHNVSIKVEVSIDITLYRRLMEAYCCFHKLNPIRTELMEMKLGMSHYGHKSIPGAKFEDSSSSSFGDMTSQNFP